MYTFEHKGITYRIPSRYNTDDNIINAIKFYLDNGRVPSLNEMKSTEYERTYGRYASSWTERIGQSGLGGVFGMEYDESDRINKGLAPSGSPTWEDIYKLKQYIDSDEFKKHLKEDNPNIVFDEKTGKPVIDEDTGLAKGSTESSSEEYNPYVHWLEQQRMNAESQELGLLNQQTRAGQQNAEISAQQAMIQQAQLRDQIIEQIKLDRMSKLRQGITPMQIANESLQFTVGNMQANNNQMTGINQARLAAIQQQGLNPYQAYLNSINSAGYQVQSNVASGMAATDASDMYMQALRYARSQGRNYIKPEDYAVVQGMPKQ